MVTLLNRLTTAVTKILPLTAFGLTVLAGCTGAQKAPEAVPPAKEADAATVTASPPLHFTTVAEPKATPAPVDHVKRTIELQFDFKKTELTDADKAALDEARRPPNGMVADLIIARPEVKEYATASGRKKIGEARAQALTDYFVTHGVPLNVMYIDPIVNEPWLRPLACKSPPASDALQKSAKCTRPKSKVEIEFIFKLRS